MFRQSFLTLVLANLAFCGIAAQAEPRIIFDTDFGGDADDLGALAMLHNMMREGECELLAVMNWNTERYALPAIAAVNAWYGHPDIPIGMRNGGLWEADWQYGKSVVDALGAADAAIALDATRLYRQLLGQAEDRSITIVTVGPLANILALLESGADEHSPLSGHELVRQKVARFVVMGGSFPAGDHEWNFDGDMPGVTQKVFDGLDVPVVFSGYEVGKAIRTGESLNSLDASHPLFAGYRHFSEHAPWMKDRFAGRILDNASFDQSAVLFAVRGGVARWWTLSAPGTIVADPEGGNRWTSHPDGLHRYLVMKSNPDRIAGVIRDAMLGMAFDADKNPACADAQRIGRFEPPTDLFMAQFDIKTDVDDLHSVAAVGSILSSPGFACVRYVGVAGAYGTQGGDFIPAPALFDLAFGSNWLDAHGEHAASVRRAGALIADTVAGGGDVWIMEGGQSDFSAAALAIALENTSAVTTRARVHVVQHSDWNEDVTSRAALDFVRANADYRKIPDGNATGNGTPGYRTEEADLWHRMPDEGHAARMWKTARDLANAQNGVGYENTAIRAGGFDFSDTVEAAYVFGLEDLEDAAGFLAHFFGP